MSLRVIFSEQIAHNPSKALRILDPLRFMEAAGMIERIPLESLGRRRGTEVFADTSALDSTDVVFLHITDMNVHTRAVLTPFLRAADERGVAIVCDTDDPYFVHVDGVSFQQQTRKNLDSFRELCRMAHVLSVTTQPLKSELESLAREIVVVPNHLDLERMPVRRRANQRLKIGWCGGPTHTDDLTAVLPAIALLQRELPVDFVIFGMFDRNFEDHVEKVRRMPLEQRARNETLATFGRLADALRDVRYEHVPSTSYAEFPARLAELDFDIGVCPLLDTRFNRCRSAVKFYQYAGAGTLTCASDAPAYRGECAQLVENSREAWYHALRRFASDPALREAELERQRDFVKTQRGWPVGVQRYAKLFALAIERARAPRRTTVA